MTSTRPAFLRAAALLATATLALAACGQDAPETQDTAGPGAPVAQPDPTESEGHGEGDGHGAGPTVKAPPLAPLRPGERRVDLAMPTSYTPSPPTGVGMDDYRCFLLDPELTEPAFLTGTTVRPGEPAVVHHVILFQVPPDRLEDARAADAAVEGPGWTCFGDAGIGNRDLNAAPWLGAWAPGGSESVYRKGLGVRLEPGTRIVMQVHYSLIASDPIADVSATSLRLAPGDADVTPVRTMLLPAPVELPCRPESKDGPLCSRDAALADVQARFGAMPGTTANALHFLCPGSPPPGSTTSCDRTLDASLVVHGVAGHMHLLGRSIRLEVNPGTPRARTLLDIPSWNFDDQGATPVDAVRLRAGDVVRVTCTHDQALRDTHPVFAEQAERYVLWGEGTTDEMCLGILQTSAG